MLEAKGVKRLRLTKQLEAQATEALNRGENLNLIVSPRTETVTKELREAIESTGGKIYRYD